jgi:diguanylate cyclase (GGDEF)-like protein
VLVVAHAAGRARGFTNLCQRIGHALADAAEPLLLQAISHEELTLERDRYAIAAKTDGLTGLENRAAWDELLAYEDARRARYDETVSIVSADLDDLKGINDRDGHAAGDRAIRAAGELLRGSSRAVDRVARVGGDEFLVLLPETDELGMEMYVERLRQRAGIAISLGGATSHPGECLVETVRRADAAMYADKAARGVHRSPSIAAARPIRILAAD